MRNHFPLCILNFPCIRSSIRRNRKALQVVKTDGKVIEFTAPVLVKELLIKFEGFGVKSSRKTFKLLPPSFELQMGKTYYLLPLKSPDQAKSHTDTVSAKVEHEPNTAVKRIKVVITKKQLQELLSKKASVEKIIFRIDKACSISSEVSWKPSLISIPEENELNIM